MKTAVLFLKKIHPNGFCRICLKMWTKSLSSIREEIQMRRENVKMTEKRMLE